MPQFLFTTDPEFETQFRALLSMKREEAPDVNDTVQDIIADVRTRGDAALIELTEKFDRVSLTPETLAISADEIAEAEDRVSEEEFEALQLATARIRAYHERQGRSRPAA